MRILLFFPGGVAKERDLLIYEGRPSERTHKWGIIKKVGLQRTNNAEPAPIDG